MRILRANIYLFVVLFFHSAFSLHHIQKKYPPGSCDSIHVWKSKKRMTLFSGKKYMVSYNISIGMNSLGPKQKQGDNRTPEGRYYIHDKNEHSSYYKNLGISYPNKQDRLRANQQHVRTGGDIKIHGYADASGNTNNRSIKYAYTWGCIAVTNSEMDEIFYLVRLGAIIVIEP